MTTNHIDQLAEWWENAEEGVINEGDRLIYRDGDDYDFRTAGREDAGTDAEKEHEHGWGIMSRAPKPKPAWHDAVAVIASTDRTERQVWEREGDGTYSGSAGDTADDFELRNVTPLIEAKVTDEMVERLEGHFLNTANMALPAGLARRMLHAALGLEAV